MAKSHFVRAMLDVDQQETVDRFLLCYSKLINLSQSPKLKEWITPLKNQAAGEKEKVVILLISPFHEHGDGKKKDYLIIGLNTSGFLFPGWATFTTERSAGGGSTNIKIESRIKYLTTQVFITDMVDHFQKEYPPLTREIQVKGGAEYSPNGLFLGTLIRALSTFSESMENTLSVLKNNPEAFFNAPFPMTVLSLETLSTLHSQKAAVQAAE